MLTSAYVIGSLWIVFLIYWLISALGAKRSVRDGAWRRELLIRLALIVVFFVLLKTQNLRHFLIFRRIRNPIVDVVGVALCVAGIAFAISARAFLGKNWGIPMSRRVNPELITSGPYRLVRHPIYTGILIAVLGSALVLGPIWWLMFLWFGVYFIYSARKEEQLMAQQFPNQYPDYKKRTKMLVPFVI